MFSAQIDSVLYISQTQRSVFCSNVKAQTLTGNERMNQCRQVVDCGFQGRPTIGLLSFSHERLIEGFNDNIAEVNSFCHKQMCVWNARQADNPYQARRLQVPL
jgi:hypothetical protein